MATQNNSCDNFVDRVQEIPMISATVSQALNVYERTKNYNRLMNATLMLAENSVKYALVKSEPVRKIFDKPIVATNKLACQQLDKIEEKFPSILSTPEELMKNSQQYYETSYIKSGVDTAYSLKNYGVTKVNNSKQMATSLYNGAVYGSRMKISDVLRFGMLAINNALNYSDSLIDAYIAPPSNDVRNGPGKNTDDDALMITRVHRMSTKVANGLKYKASNGYVASKEYALQVIGQLQAALVLLDHVKNTTGWSSDEAIAKLMAAQKQVEALWREVQKRAGQYGSPELALLHLIQTISSTFSVFSDQILKYTASYLSEGLEKNVAYAVQYAHDLNESVSQAKTLGELKTEVVTEAKERLAYVQTIFMDVLDRVAVYPPISWLAPSATQNGAPAMHYQNGVVDGKAKMH